MGWLAGCQGQKFLCSTDNDCPFGACNTTLGRCVLKSCVTDQDCSIYAFCDRLLGNVCTAQPDGGGDDGTCSSPCPPERVCRGGDCRDRYSGIAITRPTQGEYLDGGSALVVAQLNVKFGYARADPPSLDLNLASNGTALPGGTLSIQDAGLYQGPLNPTADGTYQLTASYAGTSLISPPVTVTVDRIPPSFFIQVPSPGRAGIYLDPVAGANAWRRDELVILSIQSSEPNMVNGSVRATVTGVSGAGGTTLNVQSTTGCGQNYCGTVTVDMKTPPMNAFRGTYGVVVSGQDLAGNVGTSDGGIAVTRWKWAVAPDNGAIKGAPAVGASGTVYVGTQVGATTGSTYALNPDGTVKWSVDAGSVEGAPAVGDVVAGVETVYVGINAASTSLRALKSTDGSEVARCTPGSGAGPIRTGVAITKTMLTGDSSNRETAFAVVSENNYHTLALRPGASTMALTCVDANQSGNVQTPLGMAVDGNNNVYFADNSGKMVSYSFGASGWGSHSGWPVNFSISFDTAPAIDGTVLMSGAAGNSPTKGAMAAVRLSGSILCPSPPAAGTNPAWNPSIASGDKVFYGDDGLNLNEIIVNGCQTVNPPSKTLAVVKSAPAIGADGLIYTSDSSGNLAVWDANLSSQWSANLGATSLGAAPTLDCSRDSSGAPLAARPGVLYVAADNGFLYAVVVDSRGIDPNAPWPKFQHDPRNTGNQTTSLAPFACP